MCSALVAALCALRTLRFDALLTRCSSERLLCAQRADAIIGMRPSRVLLESHPAMSQVLAILSPNMLSSVGQVAPSPPPQALQLPAYPFPPPPSAPRT